MKVDCGKMMLLILYEKNFELPYIYCYTLFAFFQKRCPHELENFFDFAMQPSHPPLFFKCTSRELRITAKTRGWSSSSSRVILHNVPSLNLRWIFRHEEHKSCFAIISHLFACKQLFSVARLSMQPNISNLVKDGKKKL